MSSRSSGRRSARSRGSNELVDGQSLPGGGTRKDVRKLSKTLGVTESVVISMMTCEGRGIRGENDNTGSGDTPSTPSKGSTNSSAGGLPFASPSTSNAWADFIQEEGVNLGAGASASAASNEPSSRKRKKGSSSADDNNNSSSAGPDISNLFANSKSSGPVEYDLSGLAAIISTKKSSKKKAGQVRAPAPQATNHPRGSGKKGSSSADDNNNSSSAGPDISNLFANSKSSGPVEYDLSGLAAIISTKKSSKKKAATSDDTSAGSLVQSGTLDSTFIGRKKFSMDETALYHLVVPSVLLPKVPITKVCTGCNAAHAIAIDTSNNAYGWGRNEGLQLGSDPYNNGADEAPKTVATPQVIANDVQSAALGKAHTILLQTDGALVALGQNKSGECGWRKGTKECGTIKECSVLLPDGSRSATDETPVFVKISCGEDFSVAIDNQGRLYSTGSSEYGQLGNGETGEHFISANKLAFANCYGFLNRSAFHENEDGAAFNDHNKRTVPIQHEVRFQDVACGKHHCLALEAPSTAPNTGTRVFSWGSGSYGCLGHGRQKDEYFPRHLAAFPRGSVGTSVAAGSTCSMVLTAQGHVYYWGKHRNNAEAVMQPRLVDALANNQHEVTHIAAGAATVACTTTLGNTVVWGQGPYGELGLKDKRSSAQPAFVEALEGLKVSDLACGAGCTLYVIKDDKTLPTVDLAAVETALKEE
mmetsp:Transcript_30071/g.73055  ORF Transcript_30071/g.73055 Transcript_30071/m.73055 type:complete len:703 (-) Transcript_30071:133-2241(-)